MKRNDLIDYKKLRSKTNSFICQILKHINRSINMNLKILFKRNRNNEKRKWISLSNFLIIQKI